MEKQHISSVEFDWVDKIEPSLAFLAQDANLNAYTQTRKSVEQASKPQLEPLISGYISRHNKKQPLSYVSPLQPLEIHTKPITYVLNHTLEQVADPLVVLRHLRRALKAHPQNCAYIIFNDPHAPHAQGVMPKRHLPTDKSHYREWAPKQLCELLYTLGFTIQTIKATDGNEYILQITASEANHRSILSQLLLPEPKKSLIITTEHADTKSTGGIGSYVKEVERVLGNDRPMVLTVTPEPFEKIMTTPNMADNIIDIHRLIRDPFATAHTTDWESASMSVYVAMKIIAALYDQLHIVEYQEYQGIGARLAQAKRSHEIPADMTLVARCHGSQVYIDRASYSWSGMEKADEFELERLSMELADEVSIPTQYLKDLYTSTGYHLPEANSYIARLPYSYPDSSQPTLNPVTQLIFLGKRSAMKGFPSFYEVVDAITDKERPTYNPHIVAVHVIAAPGDASEPYDNMLAALAKERGLTLRCGPLPRHEVLETLKHAASSSIVCLPYGGDNHPVTILEMIANYCRFIAYSNGGIPELIPQEYREHFVCAANPENMATKVDHLASMPLPKASQLIKNLHAAALDEQEVINSQVRTSYLEPRHKTAVCSSDHSDNLMGLASVVVPIYNTNLSYVDSVITCLNRQTLKPEEILFVNDASPEKGYQSQLNALLKTNVKVPYRLITHSKNLGLAGARNTGLAECTTKYLINLDSDDVVSNDFILDYVRFMERNPEYSAISCGLESFSDGVNWNSRPHPSAYSYVGLGSCLVLGVAKNIFGHAGACVKVEDARKLGGWDASDRSKWEDWAFFLKMTSAGMKIFNFPKMNYFYRVTPGSMARTYANYPAEMRVARNISGLSIWESHRLYAFIKDEAYRTSELEIEPDTLTYRIAKRTSQTINRLPIVKKVVKKLILTSWGAIKLIKK